MRGRKSQRVAKSSHRKQPKPDRTRSRNPEKRRSDSQSNVSTHVSRNRPWHRDDPDTAKRFLHAAFETGQLLNQVGWHLEQAALLGKDQREPLLQSIKTLAGKVFEALPDFGAAIETQNGLLQKLERWPALLDSESFDEDVALAWQSLERLVTRNHKPFPIEETVRILETVTSRTDTVFCGLCRILERGFDSFSELWNTVQLGEKIDQNLRPPNVSRYIVSQTTNKDWQRARRHSKAVKAPLLISPLSPVVQITPIHPPRYLLLARSIEPGEIARADAWAEIVTGLSRRLGLDVELRADLPVTTPFRARWPPSANCSLLFCSALPRWSRKIAANVKRPVSPRPKRQASIGAASQVRRRPIPNAPWHCVERG